MLNQNSTVLKDNLNLFKGEKAGGSVFLFDVYTSNRITLNGKLKIVLTYE